MNMQGIELLTRLVILVFLSSILLNILFGNLTNGGQSVMGSSSLIEHEGRIQQRYTKHELLALNLVTKIDKRLAILPSIAIKRICRLRLNRRGRRGGRLKRHASYKPEESVVGNLTQPKTKLSKERIDRLMKVSTLNAQSIKNKFQGILLHLFDNNIDVCVITETWMENNDRDNIWLASQVIQDFGFKMELNNRHRKGGGIALIYKNKYQLLKSKTHNGSTFQSTCWSLKIGTMNISILGIYHPPFGSTKNNTPIAFLDEFTELLTDLLPETKNFMLMGDVNIHLNKYETDYDAQVFIDTIEALGLKMHNDFHLTKEETTLI